jgi:hypothetical protein
MGKSYQIVRMIICYTICDMFWNFVMYMIHCFLHCEKVAGSLQGSRRKIIIIFEFSLFA